MLIYFFIYSQYIVTVHNILTVFYKKRIYTYCYIIDLCRVYFNLPNKIFFSKLNVWNDLNIFEIMFNVLFTRKIRV